MARDIRGFRDEQTGIESRRRSCSRVIDSRPTTCSSSPSPAPAQAGLLTPDGKPMITAHQFRHTVGTELAEGGARLHTIMKMPGHTSTEMTLVDAYISDRAVVEDYQHVLGPRAVRPDRSPRSSAAGSLPAESVEWLKANFFKTELSSALPALAAGGAVRVRPVSQLRQVRDDARVRAPASGALATRAGAGRGRSGERLGRERERHACAARCIEQLLAELGEPLTAEPTDPVY